MKRKKVTKPEAGAGTGGPGQGSAESSSHGKWYEDACGTAFAMELLGARWSLLVVRELLLGALRFNDLRAALPGVSAKVLAERLAGLEQAGVLVRRQLPPPAAMVVYELTAWGYGAESVICELGRWAAMSTAHDPTLPISPVSVVLSMRTMFAKARAGNKQLNVSLEIAGQKFLARVRKGALDVGRASDGHADAVLQVPSAPVLPAFLYGDATLEQLEAELGLVVVGDRAAVRAFRKLFVLPEKIGGPPEAL